MEGAVTRTFIDKVSDRLFFWKKLARRLWVQRYTKFALGNQESIFLSIARFCHGNRPTNGYYFEFGCHEANTMRMAWKHTRHLFNWTYVAFDSFQGFPEPSEMDRSEVFQKGRCATSEEEFIRRVVAAGMPRRQLWTVHGFYNESLTDSRRNSLLPMKAAVIYIDCDLYASTVDVLKFIVPFLQPGTILVFDDWQCFRGDPEKGQKRAWREFCEAHPKLKFEPWISTNEAQAFIHI